MEPLVGSTNGEGNSNRGRLRNGEGNSNRGGSVNGGGGSPDGNKNVNNVQSEAGRNLSERARSEITAETNIINGGNANTNGRTLINRVRPEVSAAETNITIDVRDAACTALSPEDKVVQAIHDASTGFSKTPEEKVLQTRKTQYLIIIPSLLILLLFLLPLQEMATAGRRGVFIFSTVSAIIGLCSSMLDMLWLTWKKIWLYVISLLCFVACLFSLVLGFLLHKPHQDSSAT